MACDCCYLDNVINMVHEDLDISDTAIVIAVPEGNPKGVKVIEDLTQPGIKVAVKLKEAFIMAGFNFCVTRY